MNGNIVWSLVNPDGESLALTDKLSLQINKYHEYHLSENDCNLLIRLLQKLDDPKTWEEFVDRETGESLLWALDNLLDLEFAPVWVTASLLTLITKEDPISWSFVLTVEDAGKLFAILKLRDRVESK